MTFKDKQHLFEIIFKLMGSNVLVDDDDDDCNNVRWRWKLTGPTDACSWRSESKKRIVEFIKNSLWNVKIIQKIVYILTWTSLYFPLYFYVKFFFFFCHLTGGHFLFKLKFSFWLRRAQFVWCDQMDMMKKTCMKS